jgi:hypothetical protein
MRYFNWVNAAILTIIVVILYYVFIGRVGKTGGEIIGDKICRESIELSSKTKIFGEFDPSIDLKCPTDYIEVSSNEQEVVFRMLADALAQTWNEFLEGKEAVFDTATENYCVVRRVIEFKEEETYSGFIQYLVENNPKGRTDSYLSYLSNTVGRDKIEITENEPLLEADEINTATPYAAVFIISQREKLRTEVAKEAGEFISLPGELIGILKKPSAVAGQFVTYLFSPEQPVTWDAGVVLIPFTEESLNNLHCTTLPVGVIGKQR